MPVTSLESADTRNVLPRDQQMNIVGTFISYDTLQVHHMTHDRKLARNAHSAQYLSGIAAYPGRYVAGISLSHTYLLGSSTAFIHQYAQTPVE